MASVCFSVWFPVLLSDLYFYGCELFYHSNLHYIVYQAVFPYNLVQYKHVFTYNTAITRVEFKWYREYIFLFVEKLHRV